MLLLMLFTGITTGLNTPSTHLPLHSLFAPAASLLECHPQASTSLDTANVTHYTDEHDDCYYGSNARRAPSLRSWWQPMRAQYVLARPPPTLRQPQHHLQ